MKMKILAAVALLGASVGAHATVMTFTDPNDPTPDVLIKDGASAKTYTHDINDAGYNKATDTLLSAKLTLWVYDDSSNDEAEYLSYKYDGINWVYGDDGHGYNNEDEEVDGTKANPDKFTFFPSLGQLSSDGLLSFSIKSNDGDFYFAKSELQFTVDRKGGSTSVPEPTTLALLSLGLLGVGAARRRRA